jgi:hypothetical protein
MASVLLQPPTDDQTRMGDALADLASGKYKGEMSTYTPPPSERVGNWLQDAILGIGNALGGSPDSYRAGHVAHGVRDFLQYNPVSGVPFAAADAAYYNSQNQGTSTALAALGILPSTRAGLAAVAPVKDATRAGLQQALLGSSRGGQVAAPNIGETAAQAVREAAMPKGAAPAATSTVIPDIRGMPVDEAVKIARTQPHLIPSNARAEGAYVGGPRTIQSMDDLEAARRYFDKYVAADPRGGNWYDRYREALNRTTGGDPTRNLWAGNQQGQWSAGVDPGSELHYVLKELNSSIAGMPERANYGAQHRAHLRALAANDPSLYQLADKTEEYATHVNPDYNARTATGVNDFRHMRNWGYTEASGLPQKGAATPGQHRFLDYETALAVDRANKANLGGRSDWTGEQLQAAPWVRQKALDIMSRNKALTYDEAFARANTTIGDFYPKHTYNAPYEAQPGVIPGHMPQSAQAEQAARNEYYLDPASTWATAPMGRDAIYGGLGTPGTGNAMRVLPTEKMQGIYTNAAGVREANPGEIAHPLGTFTTGQAKGEPFKRATGADRAIMNAGEYLRALIDAQQAGSWHKAWSGGPLKESASLYYPKAGGPASLGELLGAEAAGTPHGLPDVTATGGGALSTSWWPPPAGGKGFDKAMKQGALQVPGLGIPERVRVDSNLASLVAVDRGLPEAVNLWEKEGTGEATREVFKHINATPELRAAFNNNPYIGERALAKFARDQQWSARWGAPREDIQNLRQIVGTAPPGQWIDAVEAALRSGKVSLPAVALLMTGAAALSLSEGQASGGGREAL